MQGAAGPAQSSDRRFVHVRVPATSANLGPGFDALGLALTLYDEVTVRVGGDGLVVLVDGEGAQDVPRDSTHLLVHAMQVGLTHLGAQDLLGGVEVSCTNRVPHARGLGSSAGAIVGGLVAARALAPAGAFDDDELLDIAAGLEGHPDNVAACLLGGLTLAWSEPVTRSSARAPAGQSVRRVRAIRKEPASDLVATVFVPAVSSSTEAARALLPGTVPHRDAAQNAARAALLVEAFTGRPEYLLAGTEDSLHQRYRAPAMPESVQLVDDLRSGGLAAVLSGAGPSVLVLSRAADGKTASELAEACPDGWRTHRLAVDRAGATASSAQR